MMIEKLIVNYLNEQYAASRLPCMAYAMRPADVADTYVLFEKTSSEKLNNLTTSTIAFQSYAPDLLGALELNETIKELIEQMVELDEVSAVKLQSDLNYTNPNTKQPRYQAVFDITHY